MTAFPDSIGVFLPAMPREVREVIEAARAETGIASPWFARLPSGGWPCVLEVFSLANKREVSAEVIGWIAGITMFVDDAQRISGVLRRHSFRDSAIPHALVAVATGIRGGVPASGRLWISVETLARRVVPPAELVGVLAFGLASKHALARGAALRMAQRLGEPARAAIAAERATDAAAIDEALATLAGAPLVETSTDDSALLLRLLDAWRETHDPHLEGPIVRLGTQIGRARGDIAAKSKGELEGAWLAVAETGDPADVSRLLEAPWPSQWKPAVTRVEALAKYGPDPRISLGLAEQARAFDSKGSQPLHAAIAHMLEQAPTAALVPALDAIEGARPLRETIPTYAKTRAAIAVLVPVPADPELLAEAAARDDGIDVAPLYAEVHANPGDLGARAVLADALQLAGDPRGEFIALQLAVAAGTADDKAARRAAALLAQHGDAWTGPLPGVVAASRQFERGFLAFARTDASPELIARSLDRPEWTTIERLAAPAPFVDLAPLVAKMPRLWQLEAHPSSLGRLVETGARRGIRALRTWGNWLPPAGAFPDLAVLAGNYWVNDIERFREIQRAAAALGLAAIVHDNMQAGALALALQAAAAGPPESRFTISAMGRDFTAPGWSVRVRRGDPVIDLACATYIAYRVEAEALYADVLAAGYTRARLWLGMAIHEAERAIPAGLAIEEGAPIALATTS